MGRRYKKVTRVSRGFFGDKRIETRWVPQPHWLGSVVVIIVLLALVRGCS